MYLLPRLLFAISLPVLLIGQTQIELQQSKYIAPGSGAVTRSGASKLSDTVSIKDYGAVGDGLTDDLAAINRAFAAVTLTGQKILFPAGTYSVSGTVIVPNKTILVGVGRGDARSYNTVLKALPIFPAGAALVQMGQPGQANFGVRVENMTLDGSVIAGTCLANMDSQELSYGRDLLLANCASAGLAISTANAQNSGPFENIEVRPGTGSNVTANTICIQVTGVVGFRGLQGVTCNAGATYASRPSVALAIDGGGFYRDIHVEHFATAVSLGSSANPANALVLADAQFGSDVAVGVAINAAADQNITLSGLSCAGCGTLLNDTVANKTITDASLGFYSVGDGAGAVKTVLSSSVKTGTQLAGPLAVSGNVSLGPSNSRSGQTLSIYNATPNTGVTSVLQVSGAGQGSTNPYEWHDQWDNVIALVGPDGRFQSGQFSALNNAMATGDGGEAFANWAPIWWSGDGTWFGPAQAGIAYAAPSWLKITNGATGLGSLNMLSMQLSPSGTQPACASANRGSFWFVQSASGSADHLQVCTKSASDAYSWTSVF